VRWQHAPWGFTGPAPRKQKSFLPEMTQLTQFQHAPLSFITQGSKHEAGVQASPFPVRVVSMEVVLVPVEFGHVCSSSTRGRAGTHTGPFPEGCLCSWWKWRGYFSPTLASPPQDTHPSQFPRCGAGHGGAPAETALARRVLHFDCSSAEMSMASQSAYSKENILKT